MYALEAADGEVGDASAVSRSYIDTMSRGHRILVGYQCSVARPPPVGSFIREYIFALLDALGPDHRIMTNSRAG